MILINHGPHLLSPCSDWVNQFRLFYQTGKLEGMIKLEERSLGYLTLKQYNEQPYTFFLDWTVVNINSYLLSCSFPSSLPVFPIFFLFLSLYFVIVSVADIVTSFLFWL